MHTYVLKEVQAHPFYKQHQKFIVEVYKKTGEKLDPSNLVPQLIELESFKSELKWHLMVAKAMQDKAYADAWSTKSTVHGASKRNEREADAEVMVYTALRNIFEYASENIDEKINLGKKLLGSV